MKKKINENLLEVAKQREQQNLSVAPVKELTEQQILDFMRKHEKYAGDTELTYLQDFQSFLLGRKEKGK